MFESKNSTFYFVLLGQSIDLNSQLVVLVINAFMGQMMDPSLILLVFFIPLNS